MTVSSFSFPWLTPRCSGRAASAAVACEATGCCFSLLPAAFTLNHPLVFFFSFLFLFTATLHLHSSAEFPPPGGWLSLHPVSARWEGFSHRCRRPLLSTPRHCRPAVFSQRGCASSPENLPLFGSGVFDQRTLDFWFLLFGAELNKLKA